MSFMLAPTLVQARGELPGTEPRARAPVWTSRTPAVATDALAGVSKSARGAGTAGQTPVCASAVSGRGCTVRAADVRGLRSVTGPCAAAATIAVFSR